MHRIKVMTLVGTRPEIIKLSRVLSELEKYSEHTLVHTGQNYDYELNEIFFRDLQIKKPDYFLDAAGESAAETIGKVIIAFDKVLEEVKPEAVLIYGDTNSCLAVIAAKRRKIPIFHMEAGNRCFDARVPEEINRKIIDHISDINLTLSEHARRYLISEGVRPETIFKVGSSMPEVFNYHMSQIQSSSILEQLNITPAGYVLVSLHREENVDLKNNLVCLMQILNKIVDAYNCTVIVSTHPRTRKRISDLQNCYTDFKLNSNVHFLKPFGFFDYIKLQMNSLCVISDSGSLTEDASLLQFPGVTVRETHERPEGMDEAAIVMSSLNPERVIQAIELVTAMHKDNIKMFPVFDYRANNVSKKVVRIILSYIDYVNRTVWSKESIKEDYNLPQLVD